MTISREEYNVVCVLMCIQAQQKNYKQKEDRTHQLGIQCWSQTKFRGAGCLLSSCQTKMNLAIVPPCLWRIKPRCSLPFVLANESMCEGALGITVLIALP